MQVSCRRSSDAWRAVASLDFGTTYSGFAYCIRLDRTKVPEIVTNPPWSTGAVDIAFPKTPSTILFNSKKEFAAFGFEAESKYSKLVLRNQHMDWYYFTQFKMSLYSEYGHVRRLSREFQIQDTVGKKMPAMKVFSEAIKYLKTRLENVLSENGHLIEGSSIRWVLTVPAIWDNQAKQVMRESAVMAGIPSHQLILALEPEAATLYVMTLSILKNGEKSPMLQKGSRFLNLDLGGGTADVTIHEVSNNGHINELYRPTGGCWGGTQVDNSFDKLLSGFVGADVLRLWKKEHHADYLDLIKDFEAAKRSFAGNENEDEVTLRVPASLPDTVKQNSNSRMTLEKIIKQKHEDGSIIFSNGRLIISGPTFEKLFETAINGIVEHVNSLLKRIKEISTIVLVGGFSQAAVVKKSIKKNFGNLKLIIPDQPSLTVLKGATLFGLSTDAITYRISPYTYGIFLFRNYQDGDPPQYTSYISGRKMTGQVFDIHVRAGDKLEIGKSSIKRNYTSVNPDCGLLILFVYCSTEKDPKFVTDAGCVELGDLEIKLPRGVRADVEVEMIYWDTEIVVSAVEKTTGEQAEARLDTLTKSKP